MYTGSAAQKLEGKHFSVKAWIIVKKICLCQQKRNGNDAIMFLYFLIWSSIAFKQVVKNSGTINGSTVTVETVIGKILNKNAWCDHGKVLM